MMLRFLSWLDRLLNHKWAWLCNYTWDKQLIRDVESGELTKNLFKDWEDRNK